MIDVHAHWIPSDCFDLPSGISLRDIDGELHYGDVPLQLSAEDISDRRALLANAESMGVTTSVVSPSPMNFAVEGNDAAIGYCRRYNEEMAEFADEAHGRVIPLANIPIGHPDAAVAMLEEIADERVFAGVAIPPMAGDVRLDEEPMRTILRTVARLDLCVLVHPMQLPGRGLGHHYLQNLLGNPVETATAVGAILFGGVAQELPDLRICFVHGGGVVPMLLGRWDHGWRARADVSRDLTELPSVAYRRLYFDTLVHGAEQLRLLAAASDREHLIIGSDYPFDMADRDPGRTAQDAGLDLGDLDGAALRFVGARGAAWINRRKGV